MRMLLASLLLLSAGDATVADGPRLRADAAMQRSRVAIAGARDAAVKKRAEARLSDAARAFEQKRFTDAEVAAADALRLVSGPPTRLTVIVDDADGSSRFVVREGSIEVTSGRTTAIARSGEVVTAAHGMAPRVDEIGLASPLLLEPAEGSAVDWSRLLRWSKVEGARRFHVTIARDPAFRDRVASVEADGTSAPVLPDMATGTYYWRVAAVSSTGTESMPSTPRSFRLAPMADGRTYWVRVVNRPCPAGTCPRWLAVDTESGAERAVADVDIGELGLSADQKKKVREELLTGQLAVRGTIRAGSSPEKAVLVVNEVRGAQ